MDLHSDYSKREKNCQIVLAKQIRSKMEILRREEEAKHASRDYIAEAQKLTKNKDIYWRTLA